MRDFALMFYFGKIACLLDNEMSQSCVLLHSNASPSWNFEPLTQRIPCHVLYKSVHVGFQNHVFTPEQMLIALNATLIALIQSPLPSPTTDPGNDGFQTVTSISSGESKQLAMAESQCHGLGIIRSLDEPLNPNPGFYVISAHSSKTLNDKSVDVFIRGSMNLPAFLISKDQIGERAPYINAFESELNVSGSLPRKVRRSLGRQYNNSAK